MATAHPIRQLFMTFFILFKYWFRAFKDLITGAASGIGKGVAQRLAQLGCTLVLWDVDEVNNARVAEELNNATESKRIHAMKCDLTNRENIYECAKKVNKIAEK